MNSVYAWTPSWIEISEAIVSVFVESINQTIHVYLSIFYTIKFSIKSAAEFNRILKELIFIITIISLSTYNWSFIVSIVCRNSCGVKYRSTKQLAHTTGNVVINLELKKKKKCISYSRFNKNNSHDSLPMITNRFISLFCESTSIWHSHEFGQFLYKQINFFFIKVLSFDILNDFDNFLPVRGFFLILVLPRLLPGPWNCPGSRRQFPSPLRHSVWRSSLGDWWTQLGEKG